MSPSRCRSVFAALTVLALPLSAQIAIRAGVLHPVSGPPIENAVVVIRDGKIAARGPAATTPIPEGFRVLEAKVVTPGLIDARSVVGLAGWLNQDQDQDQLDQNAPVQPELRAVDAYNPEDQLVAWVRGFGVTTLHTGHAPGQLVSGQTMVVKTAGKTVADALVKDVAMVAADLGESARREDKKSPGTRGKAIARLREELVKAREYRDKIARAEAGKAPPRDLKLEILARVLARELPLLVNAHRARDIEAALRLATEFDFRLVLGGAAEATGLLEPLVRAKIPLLLHAPMARATGDLENASFETATKLRAAGIPFAFQGGYESYVPKSRVILFEAALAYANGLDFDAALSAITLDAARILELQDRLGSIDPGKDADLALYDGNPFEYTTHCEGVLISGVPYLDRR